jgi:uncharacterized protein (TIGR04255 family)
MTVGRPAQEAVRGGVSHLNEDIPSIDWQELADLVESGRKYDHAPIVEAILEIQVQLPENATLEQLQHVMDNSAEYDAPTTRYNVEATISVSEEEASQLVNHVVGYAFQRKDGRRIVQAHVDRFVFSWLPPYEDWESFHTEALVCWERYKEILAPLRTTRLAVRFVNRIDVPDRFEIMDYVRTGVDVSRYLPQQLSGYFMQIEVPLGRSQVTARITSALVATEPESPPGLVLDIDAFRLSEIELEDAGADRTLRQHLDVLRSAKNYVFESCITDATRRLIS